jgi:hypothetical protein
MSVQHKAIIDPDIHEPKGISTAAARRVYVSNGLGSGTWSDVLPAGTHTAQNGQVFVSDGNGSGSQQFVAGSVYADMFIVNGLTSQTLSASNAFARLDPGSEWQQGEVKNATITPSSGEITLPVAGKYLVSFWCAFDTASISEAARYNFKFAVNGAVSTRKAEVQKITNGVDHIIVNASGIIPITANDVLSIFVGGNATSSGTAIVPKEAGLTVVRLSE